MKKILVTGAAGFIGFHLCKLLLENNYSVIGLDNINDYYDTNLKYARLKELGISKEEASVFFKRVESFSHKTFSFFRIDIEDKENLEKIFQKENFDVVVNLAAQAGVRNSIENPEDYINSNIYGFFNILENCKNTQVKHLIYASSSSVYGMNEKIPFDVEDKVDNPISMYAATKKTNELMAHVYSHLYKIQTTGLRFFTVYGPWGRPDMAPMLFADAISKNQSIKVFNKGKMQRDFTYVDDIVSGILQVVEKTKSTRDTYKLYNIGNSVPVKLMDFISCIEKGFDKEAEKNMLPMQPGDVERTWANVDGLKEDYNYQPKTAIETGVDAFISWFKDYNKTTID